MELTGKNWENYSTPYVEKHPGTKICTYSLKELKDSIDWMVKSAKDRNKDINEVPIFIKEFSSNSPFCIEDIACAESCGKMEFIINTWKDNKLVYTAPDSRPIEGGEYWTSRGPSDYDVSGFIKSKLAGERLTRLVRYILDKDEIKTHLDYRESEPNWIQFKFSAEEFDVYKLSEMARNNNDIITEKIIRECVK